MKSSHIQIESGRPLLMVDGQAVPAMAYTTYFTERSCCEDFLKAGYRVFFVNISFTTLPINSKNTGFTPFRVGVFDDPDREDYSEFEQEVEKILSACPDALIFPRIYVSMPRWWTEAHPEDTVDTVKGGKREIIFSEAFRRDGAELLRKMVAHIRDASYAPHVAGWMICGGQTQEWFHHDFTGGLCQNAAVFYPGVLPSKEELFAKDTVLSENARNYARFTSLGIAASIEHFARVIKEETERKQVVGTFYGYVFSVISPVSGTHGLSSLLDSREIDYFCSPNCYDRGRAFGIDWSDMLPPDSLKHHGKMCFMECDIRTCLTKTIQESRPGVYPADIYPVTNKTDNVWVGPPTIELSRESLRKSFAHQIAKASGIWWFDMWGGWYDDPVLMEELAQMKKLVEQLPPASGAFSAEVAFFGDEAAYANLSVNHTASFGVLNTRIAMGNIGAPYDSYLVEDASAVLEGYKAAVFSAPYPSEAGEKAMAVCREKGIPFLSPSAEHPVLTTEEIVAFIKKAGVHRYTEENDVIYAGNGVLALHCATGGEKTLLLPEEFALKCVFGAEKVEQTGKELHFTLKENATALFIQA